MGPQDRSKAVSASTESVEPLWTIDEVAAYLRVSIATVRRWTNGGLLPCYRLGNNKQRRFSRASILAFVAQHAQNPGALP